MENIRRKNIYVRTTDNDFGRLIPTKNGFLSYGIFSSDNLDDLVLDDVFDLKKYFAVAKCSSLIPNDKIKLLGTSILKSQKIIYDDNFHTGRGEERLKSRIMRIILSSEMEAFRSRNLNFPMSNGYALSYEVLSSEDTKDIDLRIKDNGNEKKSLIKRLVETFVLPEPIIEDEGLFKIIKFMANFYLIEK